MLPIPQHTSEECSGSNIGTLEYSLFIITIFHTGNLGSGQSRDLSILGLKESTKKLLQYTSYTHDSGMIYLCRTLIELFCTLVLHFGFGLVGNEALSACKTIAELWDGRLRGGDIGLVSAAGGRMAAS